MPKETPKEAVRLGIQNNSAILGLLMASFLKAIISLQNLDGEPMKNGFQKTQFSIARAAKLAST